MKIWKLIFRVKKSAPNGVMPRGLKKEVASIFRVKQSYAVNLSGVRLIGLEIMVSNEEFFHVTRIIRILEERYKLSLFEFSEKESADSNGISIKVGSKPILQVA